jgi:hypothetical protein
MKQNHYFISAYRHSGKFHFVGRLVVYLEDGGSRFLRNFSTSCQTTLCNALILVSVHNITIKNTQCCGFNTVYFKKKPTEETKLSPDPNNLRKVS